MGVREKLEESIQSRDLDYGASLSKRRKETGKRKSSSCKFLKRVSLHGMREKLKKIEYSQENRIIDPLGVSMVSE